MISYKRYKYSKLFTFEADLIFIPDSYNRKGIDPLPRFWLKPSRLIEYQNYSNNPSSVNNGYVKNEELNLYVKNIEFVDIDFVNDQFNVLKNQPPYGFTSASAYEEFVEINFDTSYSSVLDNKYTTLKNKTFVKGDPSSILSVNHYVAKMEAYKTQTFFNNKIITLGEPNSLEVVNNV